jgi:hypothetical protein
MGEGSTLVIVRMHTHGNWKEKNFTSKSPQEHHTHVYSFINFEQKIAVFE